VTWEEELGVLARERGPALVGYGYLLTGEVHAAQDLVQEALVRTFSRRRPADVEWLEAYVRRTMLHTYLNGRRSGGRWAKVVHLVAEDRQAPQPETVATARTDVHAALAQLSPRQRACVVLRHFEDLTIADVADRLAVSQGAVKRYLSEARTRLGPLLGDDTDLDVITEGARR
jgi:RNA polymerase sigma-70 factor (ECF subfamily)